MVYLKQNLIKYFYFQHQQLIDAGRKQLEQMLQQMQVTLNFFASKFVK